MTAALEGGEWSAARPGRTLPPVKTRYPFYRRLGGPQGRSGLAENLVPTGVRSRTVQPVVSHYWATRLTSKKLPRVFKVRKKGVNTKLLLYIFQPTLRRNLLLSSSGYLAWRRSHLVLSKHWWISIRPQVHEFSKNLEATSEFYTPEGWPAAGSTLMIYND